MKKWKRILGWGFLSFVGLLFILFLYIQLNWKRKFEAPLPNIHASSDSAVIARGEYIVYGPGHCAECHTNREDYSDVMKGIRKPLAGGFEFKLPFGTLYSRNITSDKKYGIGSFSDPEIARVLRYGVKPDGTAVMDFMPFYNLSDEDLTAIISFLRTQPASDRQVPENNWSILGKALLCFAIKPVGPDSGTTPPHHVNMDTTAAYGKYLACSMANCRGCHTNRDLRTGAFVGPEFGGGFVMEAGNFNPKAHCVTPNISTDKNYGRLASWSQQQFISRFRQGKLIAESTMPWGPFGNMSDNDLKAIYAFLTSIPPVNNDPGPVVLYDK